MVKSYVGNEASGGEIKEMLNILERVGGLLQPAALAGAIESVPTEIREDQEKLTRFLLLVALLDQQAESPTALLTATRIYHSFGDLLFSSPQAVLARMHTLINLKDDYKISPAIGRVLPRFAWIVLRVGAFLIYELIFNNKKLSDELRKCATPYEAADFLAGNAVLAAVLREKARFMFISWVGHPDLGIDVSNGKWAKSLFLMPVDGHVGREGVVNGY
jgi:hypothetical protein